MKRLMAGLLVGSLLVVMVPGAALTAAGDKVQICHLNGASDPGIPTLNPTTDDRTFELGQLLMVSASAVPGHRRHGDSDLLVPQGDPTDGAYRIDTDTTPPYTSGLSAVFRAAEENGLRAWKHADCFITRNPTP